MTDNKATEGMIPHRAGDYEYRGHRIEVYREVSDLYIVDIYDNLEWGMAKGNIHYFQVWHEDIDDTIIKALRFIDGVLDGEDEG